MLNFFTLKFIVLRLKLIDSTGFYKIGGECSLILMRSQRISADFDKDWIPVNISRVRVFNNKLIKRTEDISQLLNVFNYLNYCQGLLQLVICHLEAYAIGIKTCKTQSNWWSEVIIYLSKLRWFRA